ncbi:MAG TPA: glycerate kinase, partial [Chthoniobacterales bacterium]
LDRALAHLAELTRTDLAEQAGAGAAGGLGFGLTAFCGAELRSGFEVVADRIGLRDAIAAHDVVVAGEGRLDAQTLEGKAPAGVAKLARAEGKRVFAIVGAVTGGSELFERVFAVDSIANAAALLRERARELAQLLR